MKTRIHAMAGGIAFLTILVFWTSTVISELFGSQETIASVKQMILYGMALLIPAMAIAGGSGMSLGGKRTDAKVAAKKKRMPFIAMNGILVLIPSAYFLATKSSAGSYDTAFYAVQGIELLAGATNLTLLGLNIRDGLTMTGRIGGTAKPAAASGDEAANLTEIECMPAGAIIAKGLDHLVDSNGDTIETKKVVALCRCGASKKKPYCDGSHNQIGFDSEPSADHTPDKVRDYAGKDITVHYNRLLCSHAGECGKLKAVFQPSRKPWIDPDQGDPADIIDRVKACPSGALSYSIAGSAPDHGGSDIDGIVIEKDGPYRVSGVALKNERLCAGACADKFVLCRCGSSKNKPYCDGSHSDIEWRE